MLFMVRNLNIFNFTYNFLLSFFSKTGYVSLYEDSADFFGFYAKQSRFYVYFPPEIWE